MKRKNERCAQAAMLPLAAVHGNALPSRRVQKQKQDAKKQRKADKARKRKEKEKGKPPKAPGYGLGEKIGDGIELEIGWLTMEIHLRGQGAACKAAPLGAWSPPALCLDVYNIHFYQTDENFRQPETLQLVRQRRSLSAAATTCHGVTVPTILQEERLYLDV